MNGVEILSVQEVVTKTTSNWWLAGFVWIGFVIVVTVCAFCMSDDLERFEGAIVGFFVGALVGLFVFACVAVASSKPAEHETHYKVTIDDSVSMNEFLDKYEIIDREDKIYTVRERE